MKIGLYFGSFNPIHVGHLIIANHLAEYSELDKVWLVVSPQNPLKEKDSLLADYHRLAMVDIAIEGNSKLQSCNIEFSLTKPSYTIVTLVALKEKYPEHEFCLIIGADNLKTLHKWYNYEQIINNYKILVYPRPGVDSPDIYIDSKKYPNIVLLNDTPRMEVSSLFIRNAINEGKDIRYLLTEPVAKYIDEMNFYK